MATLSRVGVDAVDYSDAPHEIAETPVALRPSREFSAGYEDDDETTLVIRRAPRASWLGLLLFASIMLAIVVAAALVAVDEQVALMQRDDNAEHPGLLASQARSLGLLSESSKAARAPRPPAAPRPVLPAAAAAVEAPAAQPAPSAEPREADLRSSLHLPEVVVFDKPEASPAARVVKIAQRAHARARKHGARVRTPRVEQAPALAVAMVSSASWDEARNAARDAYAAGRYVDAVRNYERAVQANPGHALTLAGLGAARMQTGDHAGATDAYRRATRLAPDNVSLQVGLGRAYVAAGDEAKARSSFQRALVLDPGNVAARSALDRM